MKVHYDLHLLGEVVFLMTRQSPSYSREYHQAVEPIYHLPLEEREGEFERAFSQLFQGWNLGREVAEVWREFSLLDASVEDMFLWKASSSREESGELSQDKKKIGLRLVPQRFLNASALCSFLRHELMHLSDIVDRQFGYKYERAGNSPAEENLTRDRYRVLWDTYIEARLERAAKPSVREKRLQEFFQVFSSFPEKERTTTFEKIWHVSKLTHGDILAIARDPQRLRNGKASTEKAQTSSCPLCSFPTGTLVQPNMSLPVQYLAEKDFPSWKPEQGMCERCFEFYRLKAGVW